MNFSASPLRKERKRGARSLFQNVRAAKRLENLSGIKSAIKKTVSVVTAPVVQVAAPVVQQVQAVAAPVVAKVEQAVAVAAPVVQPIIAPVVQQVQAQAERAVTIANEYGVQKLNEVKDMALSYAKDPAVQNAAIMAAASAMGNPEAGQRLAQANTEFRNTYDEYNQMARAMQAINANPTSDQAAKIAAQTNAETATLLRSYIQELDERSTSMALRSSGLPADAGLQATNPWVIGGVVAGGALLLLLAMRK